MNSRQDNIANFDPRNDFLADFIHADDYAIPNEVSLRTFSTGATRDTDIGKLDYEGFLSPEVLERYAQYMHKHRKQADGTMRASDNWQLGLPTRECMKSLMRHVIDFWGIYRIGDCATIDQDLACAILFNVMAILFNELKGVNTNE